MTGGDFYAISDDQLKRLLAGQLDYKAFLQAGGGEQPRESFAKCQPVWYELSQVLQAENGCGAQQTSAIPEMCGYSSSAEVQETARKLLALAQADLRSRCGEAIMEAPVDQVVEAVKGLTDFYQRAASNKDAVLFRVT
jgi:hypothetical protein